MRDELLSTEQFDSLLEARVLIGDWKHEYNTYRPHSSLGWRSPVAYATAWKAENQVDRLSKRVDL
jgi:putative transposase